MKRLIIPMVVLLLVTVTMTGCASSRKKHYGDLKGLMLLDDKQLGKNKAYYSSHHKRTTRTRRK